MRKRFTKIICLTAAVIVALGIFLVSACSKTFKAKPLGGNIFTEADAVSNGGFAVEKGDYIYFINGVESNTAANEFGSVVKGAVMRISKDNLAARNYAEADAVVPLVTYSGSYNAGIFVYGDYIYYTTPSTEKNSNGEVQNTYLAFKRTKLDGTETMKDYFMQYPSLTVDYRYVEADGVVYLVYVATSENLYGTSCTNIHSLNTETGVDTLLAYNVSSVMFDKYDLTNPRIYYTMNVTDFVTGTSFSGYYNQIYTVTADATEANEYDFSGVDGYDPEEDPLYVNCGTLVLDGIGKIQGMTESVTPFNGEGAGDVQRSAYTYALSRYQNGMLFFTVTSKNNSTAGLYCEKESDMLSESWKPVASNPAAGDYLIVDGSSASSYTYLFDGGELDGVLIAETSGLVKADISDGKIAVDYDNVNRYYITKDGQATPLFTAVHDGKNYIYYSLTGGNGYTFYRVSYDGTYADYNKLPAVDEVNEFTPVRILDIDASSDWYLPEMFDGQILFASETTNMSDYNYVMVCDLRKDGKVMTNAEIDALNELYESVEEAISDIDEQYENLPDALRYAFYTGDKEYLASLIEAYVDVMDYSEEQFWSKQSVAIYNAFIDASADGEWSAFSSSVTVNGEEVKANRSDYYYSLLGVMTEEDAESYAELLKTTYLQPWPEEDESWWEGLSTGAKVGFVIGVCAGGLIVIAAAVIVALVIVRKRRSRLPVYKKKRIKVDTTDDRNIDVYSDGKTGENQPPEESSDSE